MKISLNLQIFIGALLGIIFGIVLGHSHLPQTTTAPWLNGFEFLGKIFISLLKIIMAPLVFSAIATGIANLKNSSDAKRIWPALIAYSFTTTALAATTGLVVMNLVKAGVGLNIQLFKENINNFKPQAMSIGDFGHRLMENVFMHPLAGIGQNNILSIVFLAFLTGIGIILLGQKADDLLKIINKFFELMMTIVRIIMHLAPIGIMGLLTTLVASQSVQLLYILSKYILVVVATTLFHGAITLPLILWLLTRISPWKFFVNMKEAFITAFSTSSSTATLPVSLRCITENLHIDRDVSRFVLPVGATLNMDGTAMYESMAALFVANLCGIHLSLSSQIVVVLMTMLASVGAPGIPSAGMVTMVMVLQTVGLPVQAVAILIAIDRPLDTIRTVVNVEGDCVGACVIDAYRGRHIGAQKK